MVYDLRKCLGNITAVNCHLMMFAPENIDHQSLKPALIVLGILEAQRKGLEPVAADATAERRHERAVEPPRQIAAHGHIGSLNPQLRSLCQRSSQSLHSIVDIASVAIGWRSMVLR